jgi:hypothetical protein
MGTPITYLQIGHNGLWSFTYAGVQSRLVFPTREAAQAHVAKLAPRWDEARLTPRGNEAGRRRSLD